MPFSRAVGAQQQMLSLIWLDLILIDCSLFINAAMFKLKAQNVAFFAIAPTLMSKYCYQ